MTTESNKKSLYKAYLQEAVGNLREQEVLKLKLKELKDVVKENDFDVKEFTQDVKTAFDKEKVEKQLESLQISIDSIENLRL